MFPPTTVTSPCPSSFRRAGRVILFTPLTLLLAAPPSRAADPPPPPSRSLLLNTAGALMVVGGGKMSETVRARFLELAGGNKARLVVIPTASSRIDNGDISPSYTYWQSQHVSSVELLHTRNRGQADEPGFVKPLESATGVWFTGGDQSRLTASYLGTAVMRELRKVLDRGGVIAGTSAGASVMSGVMITGGTTRADIDEGFGLAPGFVVDQHFTNRNRMGRLLGVLTRHPDLLGVGIDEQTAAVIKGHTMSVVGDANVYICMTATPAAAVNVQRLKQGDQLDLDSLSQTLYARNRLPTDKSATLTSVTKAPAEAPTMGKAR